MLSASSGAMGDDENSNTPITTTASPSANTHVSPMLPSEGSETPEENAAGSMQQPKQDYPTGQGSVESFNDPCDTPPAATGASAMTSGSSTPHVVKFAVKPRGNDITKSSAAPEQPADALPPIRENGSDVSQASDSQDGAQEAGGGSPDTFKPAHETVALPSEGGIASSTLSRHVFGPAPLSLSLIHISEPTRPY